MRCIPVLACSLLLASSLWADDPAFVDVEGQPLAGNARRLAEALEYLGSPLPAELRATLKKACDDRDAKAIQKLLDPRVLLVVSINPEARVKVHRGPAKAMLQQAGYTPVLVKVLNDSGATHGLRIASPQAGPPYAGASKSSLQRQEQPGLNDGENTDKSRERFLHVEMFTAQPMTKDLSGLKVEYAIALVYSSDSGKREATLTFDIGQGTQDLGFRAEVPILFDVARAVPVDLSILDHDGKPTTGRLLFRDSSDRVHPPQPRRLAPDLFFQAHVYRHDGERVWLPPGDFTVFYNRGPEYRWKQRKVVVPATGDFALSLQLERWVHPRDFGFYSGDHHVHAAGCAHYTHPTEGILPIDVFRQIKGEGLNVGCILTWGPCYDFQHRFFRPDSDKVSEPLTLIKYDVEVSGFGSQALGHVCLLNLKDQAYPGSDGVKGWPTWTTPVLRWAKKQGAVTGYAHSASGLEINPKLAAVRLLARYDSDNSQSLSEKESKDAVLPEAFMASDKNGDGVLSEAELVDSLDRAADFLPNLAIPELNSVGAQEIFVTVEQGLCDFISAMDTPRLAEWNCWYHILNCGYPLKVSGETDFPCMASTRVGQGRSYVQLGKLGKLDYTAWCEGLRQGRSYVSDGYAHALEFTVNDKRAGDDVRLREAGKVTVKTKVAFASETPLGVAHGTIKPKGGTRLVGDTVLLRGPRPTDDQPDKNAKRLVELVVNGEVVARLEVPADDRPHELTFDVKIDRSSWVAIRQFPQLHTNPVNVLVGDKPIRASRQSALWCAACIERLWEARHKAISEKERPEAEKTFQKAIATYRKLADDAANR